MTDTDEQKQAEAALVLIGAISAAVSNAIKEANIIATDDVELATEVAKLGRKIINSLPS